MTISIIPERADTPDAVTLITELESILAPLYPTESRHGYSVEKLIQQGVAFFLIRVDGVPAGCGGIQLFGDEYGELKRMYVRPQFRGLGLSKRMIEHLVAFACERNITLLRLETGIHQQAAIRLYERAGFRRIPPFGEYKPDPVSLCFEMQLECSE